jgi:hypothetical protein
LNVVCKVVATGPPQPVPLELHDEPFAGFPEVAVSGVPLGGVDGRVGLGRHVIRRI